MAWESRLTLYFVNPARKASGDLFKSLSPERRQKNWASGRQRGRAERTVDGAESILHLYVGTLLSPSRSGLGIFLSYHLLK